MPFETHSSTASARPNTRMVEVTRVALWIAPRHDTASSIAHRHSHNSPRGYSETKSVKFEMAGCAGPRARYNVRRCWCMYLYLNLIFRGSNYVKTCLQTPRATPRGRNHRSDARSQQPQQHDSRCLWSHNLVTRNALLSCLLCRGQLSSCGLQPTRCC